MTDVPFADRQLPAWFDEAKFGIFIHWGPYAVPCYAPVEHDMGDLFRAGNWEAVFRSSPYTEWYMNSWAIEGSPTAAHHLHTSGASTYADFVEEFHQRSAGCSVADWVPLFAAAGARYVVPVTKHHDGFLMWPSEHPNPHRQRWMAERDHIADLAIATRSAGMRFGVYYSGGLDWTFTPPPVRNLAEMLMSVPNSVEYGEYATAQVFELIERHRPEVLWGDIGWPWHRDPNELFARFYEACPEGVVNDRWNLIAARSGTLHADFVTPEYSTEAPPGRKFEVCRGLGRSFGYNRMESESTLPSLDELIWMLVDIVARGGNLLLNVGPTADGQVALSHVVRYTALGWWLRVNASAVYGTRPGGVSTTADGRRVATTLSDTARYAIVEGAPNNEVVVPCPRLAEGSEVRMLGNSRPLGYRWTDGWLRVDLPDHLPPAPATALEIVGAASE